MLFPHHERIEYVNEQPAMRTLFVITLLSTLGSHVPLSKAAGSDTPKLTLVIIIDQMRRDYLDRFDDLYGPGGFHLLTQRGARFVNCSYPYSATFTGPGHSAILSGISPARSGIIGNDWYNMPLSRSYYCSEDSTVIAIGTDPSNIAGKVSPANFNGESICDALLQSSPGSKAIGIALKDRGAILPAGKHPTCAFWFDATDGHWISSSYYADSLPGWATKFNDRNMAGGYLGKEWLKLLPEDAYARQGPDNGPGEGRLPGEVSSVFPHHVGDPSTIDDKTRASRLRRFEPLLCTPYGNDLTISFAEAAIIGEGLGTRGVPDILSVSFSSPDYCGHIFGPDSHEIEDMMLRLDRQLNSFFQFVDSVVGLGNVGIVLTADHGVAPLPEQTAPLGGLRLIAGDYLLDIKVHMGQWYDYNEGNDNLVRSLIAGGIWIDTAGVIAHRLAVDRFEEEVAHFTECLPGIARCYTSAQILDAAHDGIGDSLLSKVKRSFNVERSAQVTIIQKPYCIFGEKDMAVHGSPYAYDCDVPLLFFGRGFRAGVYTKAVTPLDIAPTLAHILSIRPPARCEGEVLVECLAR